MPKLIRRCLITNCCHELCCSESSGAPLSISRSKTAVQSAQWLFHTGAMAFCQLISCFTQAQWHLPALLSQWAQFNYIMCLSIYRSIHESLHGRQQMASCFRHLDSCLSHQYLSLQYIPEYTEHFRSDTDLRNQGLTNISKVTEPYHYFLCGAVNVQGSLRLTPIVACSGCAGSINSSLIPMPKLSAYDITCFKK